MEGQGRASSSKHCQRDCLDGRGSKEERVVAAAEEEEREEERSKGRDVGRE